MSDTIAAGFHHSSTSPYLAPTKEGAKALAQLVQHRVGHFRTGKGSKPAVTCLPVRELSLPAIPLGCGTTLRQLSTRTTSARESRFRCGNRFRRPFRATPTSVVGKRGVGVLGWPSFPSDSIRYVIKNGINPVNNATPCAPMNCTRTPNFSVLRLGIGCVLDII